jgi:hypothetical protein
MMDLLSHCRLSTALPLGYLLITLFLGTAILGGALAWWRFRPRPLGRVAGAVALIAAARLCLAVAAEVLIPVDLGPVVSQASLVGIWTKGSSRLELRVDGSYRLTDGRESQGTWTLSQGNISLGGAQWRVIQARGTDRIVRDWPEDPDLWDGDLGFQRAPQ